MRTTVDLSPAAHRRIRELAAASGRSLSATIADLALRGLAEMDEPVVIEIDQLSGFPVMSFGRRITDEDVASALDDE